MVNIAFRKNVESVFGGVPFGIKINLEIWIFRIVVVSFLPCQDICKLIVADYVLHLAADYNFPAFIGSVAKVRGCLRGRTNQIYCASGIRRKEDPPLLSSVI